MEEQVILKFEILLKSIALETKLTSPLLLTFTLMSGTPFIILGMRTNGEIKNIILTSESNQYDLSHNMPMTFKYKTSLGSAEDMNFQLILSDESTHRQIDSQNLSAHQIIGQFQIFGTKNIKQRWHIPDQMTIQYQISKTQIKNTTKENSNMYKSKTAEDAGKTMLRSREMRKSKQKMEEIIDSKIHSDIINENQQEQGQTLLVSRRSSHRKSSRTVEKNTHENVNQHHNSHGHHEHSGYSNKMKLVIIMLIFGFIFMVYHLATARNKNRKIKQIKQIKHGKTTKHHH